MRVVVEMRGMPKARPRVTRWSTYMPTAYTDWKQALADAVRATGAKSFGTAPLLLTVTFFRAVRMSKRTGRPTPKALAEALKAPPMWADSDNLAGGVMDALQGVLWDDDRTVDIGGSRRKPWSQDLILIQVRELQPSDWLPEEWL